SSSYLGGSGDETGFGIALDTSGNLFVTGSTSSTNFPVSTGAYHGSFGGGPFDAFVTALNSSASGLLYSTYLGGSAEDQAWAIALDPLGNAYIAGETLSSNFPTTASALQPAQHGSYDGFDAALDPSGSSLLYATFLGGSAEDYATGIAVDPSGSAYITGYTASTDFPHTAGALQPANAGGYDAFVAKLNPSGSALAYATYL